MNLLLLGSGSRSRRFLLSEVGISFVLLEQSFDESTCDWGLPLQKLVESIAKQKMEHLILPKGEEGQEIFVLTADTLTQDCNGNMLGKPETHENARKSLAAVREGKVRVGTAFCLEKKVYKFDTWQTQERILQFVDAQCSFEVPDECMQEYLEKTYAVHCSGGIMIEGYGEQFVRSIHGSYHTIIGLPLFELREALEKIGFYK